MYTSFQAYRGAVYRDETGPRDMHSLDYPYQGLVLEVVDAPDGGDRDALDRWLRERAACPARLAGSPVAMTLRVRADPAAPRTGWRTSRTCPGSSAGSRCSRSPRCRPTECWDGRSPARVRVEAAGVGRVELAAPFLPTLPGTDTYVDQLR